MSNNLVASSSREMKTPTCAGLLEHLVANHERISYAGALRALLVGATPSVRGDIAHLFRRVSHEKAGTRIGPHQIGLDTLIVSASSWEPSAPHWKCPRTYSLKDWRGLFGQWAICAHFEQSAPRGSSRASALVRAPTDFRLPPSDANANQRRTAIRTLGGCAGVLLLASFGLLLGQFSREPHAVPSSTTASTTPTPSTPAEARVRSVTAVPVENAFAHGEPIGASVLDRRLVAVFEIRDQTARHIQLARHLTDRVRILLAQRVPTARVTTHDNIVALAGGRALSELEGDGDIDAARRVGADDVISGDLRLISGQFALTLQLHDAASAQLIGGATTYGTRTAFLDAALDQAVATLIHDNAVVP